LTLHCRCLDGLTWEKSQPVSGGCDVESTSSEAGGSTREPPPPHQKALWRQLVYNRATRDRAELKFNSAIDWGHKKSIEKLLEQAQVAAGERISPLRWWNGSSQERAWLSLHEAEAEFDEELCNPELEAQAHDLLAKAEHLLKPGDERVKAVSDALAEPRWAPRPRLKPVTVAHLSRAVYDAMDRRFAESLACRNRIIRLTLISLVALGLLMAALATNAIHLGVGTPAPSALEGALLVPLFGAIGALIIAIPPLARVTGSSNPFGLQHYQMLLKVTMGPVFAILGVMLLQSGLIPGVQPATSMRFPDLLVWALVFGATQQVVTRAIDSRVAGLVSDEPTERAVGAPRNLGTAGNLNEDGQADASSKDGS